MPTGPNVPRRRRALRFLVASVVIALVTGITFLVIGGVMFRDIMILGRDLVTETEAGGTDVVDLEAGKYLVVATGRDLGGRDGDRTFTHPLFRVTDPGGAELRIRSVNFNSRTTIGTRSIVVINEFTVDQPGAHLLEVANEPGTDANAIGIAPKKEFGTGRILTAVLLAAVSGLAVIASVIAGIIAILAHRERVPLEPTGGAGPA